MKNKSNIIVVNNCSTYGMDCLTFGHEGQEKVVITFGDRGQHPFILMGRQIDHLISFLQACKQEPEKE